jgi:hypothetical protein
MLPQTLTPGCHLMAFGVEYVCTAASEPIRLAFC